MAKFLIYCAVYVFLRKDGQVYLMRRANTGWQDGFYGLPSGHVEEGESLVEAAIREMQEETGLTVEASQLQLKHATYRRKKARDRTYADYYFTCTQWQGDPAIQEPEKCDGALWVSEAELPEHMVPEVANAWRCILAGIPFSEIEL